MNFRSQVENPISDGVHNAATREDHIRFTARTSPATSGVHPDRPPI